MRCGEVRSEVRARGREGHGGALLLALLAPSSASDAAEATTGGSYRRAAAILRATRHRDRAIARSAARRSAHALGGRRRWRWLALSGATIGGDEGRRSTPRLPVATARARRRAVGSFASRRRTSLAPNSAVVVFRRRAQVHVVPSGKVQATTTQREVDPATYNALWEENR